MIHEENAEELDFHLNQGSNYDRKLLRLFLFIINTVINIIYSAGNPKIGAEQNYGKERTLF